MKKLVLPLLLLLGISMLLAQAVSEPSEVVGYVKYDCVVGNNFVALPMSGGPTLVSELGAVFGTGEDINTIMIYDTSAQDWNACVNYGGGYWEPDLDLEEGSVVFLNTTAAGALYSIGSLPVVNATYSIVTGNNTVMVPLNNSNLTLVSEVGATVGSGEDVNTIMLYDTTAQDWNACVNYGGGYWEPDLDVAIGMPLFLNSIVDTPWPSRGLQSSPSRSNTRN